MNYDVIIVGTGPAGVSAGIYTARAKLKTLIIGRFLQSRLAIAHTIHNYFGFQNGIEGRSLLRTGIKQAKKLGATIIEGEVIYIKKTNQGFEIKDSKNKKYQTKTIIIASGSKIDALKIKKGTEFINRGVHYCSVCDGPIYINKGVVVIGEGNHAAEEAIGLRAYSKDVTMVSHKDKFNISKELMKEITDKKIKLVEGFVLEFKGKNKLEKLILKDKEIKCDAAFIAPGTASSVSIARKLGLEIKDNNIVVNQRGETDIKGVFAAGEATGANKQVAICVGEGCNAAISAINYLRRKGMYTDYT